MIALAVLALSATVALAARPEGHGPKQPDANVDVPSGSEAPGIEESEAPDTDAPEKSEEPDVDESETPEATDGEAAAEHPDNHGKIVSEAAQAETPNGFANHGASVRAVARDNHGHSADKAAAKAARAKAPKK